MPSHRKSMPLRRIAGAAIDALVSFMAVAGCLCLFGIAGLILGDIVGRAAGLYTIPWKIDVAQYLLYFATFLAAPWVLREGGHVSVDLIAAMLPTRAADLLARVAALIGFGCSAMLVWYSLRALAQSHAAGTRVYKSLIFPEWYLYLPGPLVFALTGLIFARAAFTGRAGGQPAGRRTGF